MHQNSFVLSLSLSLFLFLDCFFVFSLSLSLVSGALGLEKLFTNTELTGYCLILTCILVYLCYICAVPSSKKGSVAVMDMQEVFPTNKYLWP